MFKLKYLATVRLFSFKNISEVLVLNFKLPSPLHDTRKCMRILLYACLPKLNQFEELVEICENTQLSNNVIFVVICKTNFTNFIYTKIDSAWDFESPKKTKK